MTFPSFLHELFLKGLYTRVSGALDGRRVVGLRTTARQQGLLLVATLFARPGTVLPVEEKDLVPSKGYRSLTTLTHWNERVRVRAPAHSSPVS